MDSYVYPDYNYHYYRIQIVSLLYSHSGPYVHENHLLGMVFIGSICTVM